jgi:hypothetical protein
VPKLKLEGLKTSSARLKFKLKKLGKNSLQSKLELEFPFKKKK